MTKTILQENVVRAERQRLPIKESWPEWQLSLIGLDPIEAALDVLSRAGIDERGAIFTRREVVDFILDLIGYTPDHDLTQSRLLEPSFGNGDFLEAAIERLLTAHRTHSCGAEGDLFATLKNSICAVELHTETFNVTRKRIASVLKKHDIPDRTAERLLSAWLHRGDFLLTEFDTGFNYVVGNPPYIRQELIPDALIEEYRRRYQTIFDRADIYVPFIERSLSLLAPDGTLGFICADRWMKNRYGGPLRRFVAEGYWLKYHIDMTDTPAFHSEVIAYPAISVISRAHAGPTRVAFRPRIDADLLQTLVKELRGSRVSEQVTHYATLPVGDAPWILEAQDRVAVVRTLEARFPTLEEAGCKVGIGVATGADHVFIGMYEELDVEPDRKLPLVMTRDINSGVVAWRGYGVLNPFGEDGKLVPLRDYPKLAAYLDANGAAIRARHVSKKNPTSWYRTIDRIYPELTSRPKLLIPDIKGNAHIVYDQGGYYPHHNLYYITSETWNLQALQAVLRSGIARLFVATYATKMRGGYFRFQAQYLRRIRLPHWADVPDDIRAELIRAGQSSDEQNCDDAVAHLYGLTVQERDTLLESNH